MHVIRDACTNPADRGDFLARLAILRSAANLQERSRLLDPRPARTLGCACNLRGFCDTGTLTKRLKELCVQRGLMLDHETQLLGECRRLCGVGVAARPIVLASFQWFLAVRAALGGHPATHVALIAAVNDPVKV